ncbi:MAG: hypothetical protein GXO25_05600 [Euryarchaeota archaeon]|nr:hypothetical protein [Euryarchaeota archaeon]
MFFENFMWEEEKLGLISGVSFVLIGVLGYAVYLQKIGLFSVIFLVLGMLAASGTAVLFQLPRIRGMRPAVGTFLGGMSIGGAVILWVIAASMAGGDLLSEIIVFSLFGAEIVLAFFAVGFLLLALYPPYGNQGLDTGTKSENIGANSGKSSHNRNEQKNEKVDIEEDLFDRL